MPSAKSNASEWTTVKRRRESHSNTADVKSNIEGSNGAVRPPGSSRATHKPNGSKYEDATESSLYTSTGTSRSSSPSSSGNCRGVNELAGASKKKKTNRKQRAQQENLDIDTDAFLKVCKFAEERYSHDALVQLQHCTDYIITAFKGSEISFSSIVLDQALEKAAEEPLQRLPGVFLKQASAYYAKMDISSLALLAGGLLGEMFESVAPPTTHTVSPPKAKVGVLVALALVLRAKPILALRLSAKILSVGQQYSSQQRLPFLLWALSQASRKEPTLGVAVWVRAILPQVLGQSLVQTSSDTSQPSPVQKMKQPAADRALLYLSSLLQAAAPEQEEEELNYAGLPKWHPGTRAMGTPDNPLVEAARRGYRWTDAAGHTVVEPVVPPAALTTIVSVCLGTDAKFGPLRSRLRLLRCYGALQEIAFAGFPSGGFSCAEALLQSLNLAERLPAKDSEGGKSPVLDGALANALAALEVDAEGAHFQWCGVYKMALVGSARLLRHLAATLGEQAQPLLRTSAGEQALTSLLKGLKKKYEEYPDVVEPHPSTRAQQFALARQAADSCQQALDQLRAVKPSAGSRRSLAILAVLALCCVALGMYRSSTAGSWLSARVPLPSREEAAALLHAWAQQTSTLAEIARIKAAPALRMLGASLTAATDVGARGAHRAAEHLSALQQLLRARYQSYVQHAVQS